VTRNRAILVALLAFAAFAFVACGGDDDDSTSTNGFNTTTVTARPIGTTTAAPAATNCGPKVTTDTGEPSMKTYTAEPPMTIDASKTYTAVVHTERGDFTIKLRADLAPHHVNSFIFLAKDGYFDNVTFHRVIPGFVAQTGDPTGNGNGGPGYTLKAEFTTSVPYTRGVVGMARSTSPDSAGSQWYVTYGNAPNLNGAYTVFGEVTDGMDVVDCITPRDPSVNANAAPGDKIISIDITES
jgi:peptidylprolyl isomerase